MTLATSWTRGGIFRSIEELEAALSKSLDGEEISVEEQ